MHCVKAFPAICLFLHSGIVSADTVDLKLLPESTTASVDTIVEIQIVASVEGDEDLSMAAIDAILDWDRDYLELLSVDDSVSDYTWFVSDFLPDPDGVNDDVGDGEAIYTALSSAEDPATAIPDAGRTVTTVRFRALAETAGTPISFVPSTGQYAKTRVLAFYVPGLEITGDISSIATVAIVAGQVDEFFLDIRPGSCPNPISVASQGRIPVALVGTPEFDVSLIDPTTLVLMRADGVGGAVSPMLLPSNEIIRIRDVAAPFYGELCDCHELRGDRIDDALFFFSTPMVVEELELGDLASGAEIKLTVSGMLVDGTMLEASDCIKRVGPMKRQSMRGSR
jgi:hypothetical protein